MNIMGWALRYPWRPISRRSTRARLRQQQRQRSRRRQQQMPASVATAGSHPRPVQAPVLSRNATLTPHKIARTHASGPPTRHCRNLHHINRRRTPNPRRKTRSTKPATTGCRDLHQINRCRTLHQKTQSTRPPAAEGTGRQNCPFARDESCMGDNRRRIEVGTLWL